MKNTDFINQSRAMSLDLAQKIRHLAGAETQEFHECIEALSAYSSYVLSLALPQKIQIPSTMTIKELVEMSRDLQIGLTMTADDIEFSEDVPEESPIQEADVALRLYDIVTTKDGSYLFAGTANKAVVACLHPIVFSDITGTKRSSGNEINLDNIYSVTEAPDDLKALSQQVLTDEEKTGLHVTVLYKADLPQAG